jgi:hypothetical protein
MQELQSLSETDSSVAFVLGALNFLESKFTFTESKSLYFIESGKTIMGIYPMQDVRINKSLAGTFVKSLAPAIRQQGNARYIKDETKFLESSYGKIFKVKIERVYRNEMYLQTIYFVNAQKSFAINVISSNNNDLEFSVLPFLKR